MNDLKAEFLYNAVVAPLSRLDMFANGQPGRFDGGVYRENGDVCPGGEQIKAGYNNVPQPYADLATPEVVGGRHIFGGMLQNEHFGHFMMESLCRLWVVNFLDSSFTSMSFYLRRADAPIAGFVTEILRLIRPELHIHVVTAPTRFEILAVPQQLGHPDVGIIHGHPANRNIFAPLRGLEGAGARRVYVSRSRLNPRDGGFMLETAIEDNLRAEGYEILHPQELSVKEQVIAYNAADRLIFAEGSALHLYALVAKPTQKVFMIWRRRINDFFGWQIGTFGGPAVQGTPCLSELWIPQIDGGGTVRGRALLDFAQLKAQLVDADFIDGAAWKSPDAAAQMEGLAVIRARLNWKYESTTNFG